MVTAYPYKDENPLDVCWQTDPNASLGSRGTYIAITGNTGAGKSTLVSALTQHLKKQGKRAIGINERALHHPLLPLMFYQPSKYAFGIQLNFLLQRHLVLYRWLDLGYTVVIERSHLDDRLYVETHVDQANISRAELAAYDQLSTILAQRLPDPDLYIFLDASPELSIARLRMASQSGERPEEFPNEEAKLIFVKQWQRRFQDHFQNLCAAGEQGRYPKTKFLTWPAEKPTDEIMKEIMSLLA